MTDLDTALLEEVQEVLGRLHEKYAGRPDLELEQLWLLALEREQIVAVAYREEAVAARVEALQMGSGVRRSSGRPSSGSGRTSSFTRNICEVCSSSGAG